MVRTTVFISAACSLLAFCAGVSERRSRERRFGYDLAPVVVASVDVPAGTRLTFDMISQRSVPEQLAGSHTVKPDTVSYLIGATTTLPLKAGDVLHWNDFTVSAVRELNEGKVSVAVELGHELEPGDRVDLLRGDGSAMFEDLRVLSKGTAPWLEVTPQEAKRIAALGAYPVGLTVVRHAEATH